MTIPPRYNFPLGTEITLSYRPMVVSGINENGYSMVNRDDGSVTVESFDRLVEYLRMPGANIDLLQPLTGGRSKQRLGGYESVKSLKSEEQKALGRFHLAMCEAVDIYVSRCRQEDPNYVPSIRKLGTEPARNSIAKLTGTLLGKPVYAKPPRAGEKLKGQLLYQGRTICEYYNTYKDLDPNERCAEALIPALHMRGNRSSRLPTIVRNLMTASWEKIGLDKKGASVANVHDYLETLIAAENAKRIANSLPALVVPSEKTLRQHRDSLLTPTEYTIAVKGAREAKRKRGRGSTDVRALVIGELCGMDEQKISVVTSAKEEGFWHTLSDEKKQAYEAADKYIRKRLHFLIMFDVASRMPIAWIITENPNADATLSLLRMATRDKTREKNRYGCMNEPARGCGILTLRNDNGVGLRNAATISAMMGVGTVNEITRTYSPTDRSHDEGFFGTVESSFFKLMPGYTGRRPGDNPGYDAIQNGVVDVEMLYGMLTRFLVDEYPFQRNYGVGLFGRRPWDVYKEINETRGQIAVFDPNIRRIQLGWEVDATPSDEGVRVFEGIWFNSQELQTAREEHFHKGKVKVCVDPDDLNIATVLMPGVPEPIEVTLQTTAFADMTLGEVLQIVAEYRREDPEVTEIYHDRLMAARTRRYNEISTISVEHDLPRSYSTIEECKAMAKAVFAGARIVRTGSLSGTCAPDRLTSLEPSGEIYRIGDGVIDCAADEVFVAARDDESNENHPDNLAVQPSQEAAMEEAPAPRQTKSRKITGQSMKLSRPVHLKELK